MFESRRRIIVVAVTACALLAVRSARMTGDAPSPIPPVNDAPNPYTTVRDYLKLPAGRTWGSTAAVDLDPDGRSIWVAERCGKNSCLDLATNTILDIPTVLKFDTNGNLLKAFGAGLMVFPHGIYVDRDGNVWVTDGQDNAPRPAPSAPPPAGTPPSPPHSNPAATKGHQIFKFSPDGKVLMTLGRPGGAPAPECCFQPNDVITAPNGDIFVVEGHSSIPGTTARLLKFDRTGKLIATLGKIVGGDKDTFDQPHALAFDSRGRLFVGDRNNNRIQIFDQSLRLLDTWYQFSRPSGIYIDKNDMLYVADSESISVSRNHQDWKRGIRIGSLKDGKVIAFIPDPDVDAKTTSAAEGVVADSTGVIYGAEVGPKGVKRYVKK